MIALQPRFIGYPSCPIIGDRAHASIVVSGVRVRFALAESMVLFASAHAARQSDGTLNAYTHGGEAINKTAWTLGSTVGDDHFGSEQQIPHFLCASGANDTVELSQLAAHLPTAWPVTLAAYFRPEASGTKAMLGFTNESNYMSIGRAVVGLNCHINGATPPARNMIYSTTLDGSTWVLLVAVIRSDTDRELYVDGRSVATQTTAADFPTIDTVYLGRQKAATFASDAPVRWAAAWSRALSDREIFELNQMRDALMMPPAAPDVRPTPAYPAGTFETTIIGNRQPLGGDVIG